MLKKLKSWIIRKLGGYEINYQKHFGDMDDERMFANWTKEDVINLFFMFRQKVDKDIRQENKPVSIDEYFFSKYLIFQKETKRLRQILSSDYHTEKELNRAIHVSDLEVKVKRLRQEVTSMREALETKNRRLEATGLIVNCTGCDAGGPNDWENLTREQVDEVQRIAKRLKTWWENHEYRQNKGK